MRVAPWITAALAIGVAGTAAADELALTCAMRSLNDPADSTPYAIEVRIDVDRRTVVDVEGDGGVGWVIDALTDARIEAHFILPDEVGGLNLDRAAGTIDTISAHRGPPAYVVQWSGRCLPSAR